MQLLIISRYLFFYTEMQKIDPRKYYGWMDMVNV